ncbi:MAG: hypothetical protein ACT4PP_08730 [Sporichthyaceae bacterium]
MRRHSNPPASALGEHPAAPEVDAEDDLAAALAHRRPTRTSALLMTLALLCATLTVVFGFWLADLVPSY